MRILLQKIGVEFTFPKPVGLISYLIGAFTGPDDLVLDSFAGSGTTGHAVLSLNLEQGSRRKFILIELEQSTVAEVTLPRLQAVISGHDGADIPAHGGGFRYYRLAPSLLALDKWGNWVINKDYNPAMLAEALCKLEGYSYAPSETVFWQQGTTDDRSFLYATTQQLTHEQLQFLSEDVGPGRSLLVLCTSFQGKGDGWPNLTVKRIPRAVLSRCEWGRDDYSLAVANLTSAPLPAGAQDLPFEAD